MEEIAGISIVPIGVTMNRREMEGGGGNREREVPWSPYH